MKIVARILTIGAALALGIASASAAYPEKPVKVIVPFAAGGPTDVMARLIAQKLSENLKQQFYVENRPGAGGNIGMAEAGRAAPDGYTILVASSSFVVNPSLYAKNPYDPYNGFTPITLAAASPNILVVNAAFPVKTVKELIELLKKEPGKYSIANPGIGTTPQLAAELFKLSLNLDATGDAASTASRRSSVQGGRITWAKRRVSRAPDRSSARSTSGTRSRRSSSAPWKTRWCLRGTRSCRPWCTTSGSGTSTSCGAAPAGR